MCIYLRKQTNKQTFLLLSEDKERSSPIVAELRTNVTFIGTCFCTGVYFMDRKFVKDINVE